MLDVIFDLIYAFQYIIIIQMNSVAAYLLCVLGGNETPSVADVSGKRGGVTGFMHYIIQANHDG